MDSVSWSELRTWNGTQQLAFEELCCQLLCTLPPVPGSLFVRKGTRDAGIEAYWKLPDGSEHGLQAKFFRGSPDESQFRQIEKSLRAALTKHPLLTKYTICLPTDRDNPRINGQSDFMQRWNTHVLKWKSWAAESNRNVDFEYIGESELCRLLASEQNAGLMKFWFGRDTFSNRWFSTRKGESTAQLRFSRYLPDLHIDISDLDRHIQALTHDAAYFSRLAEMLADVHEKCRKLDREAVPAALTPSLHSVLDFARSLQPLTDRLLMHQANERVSSFESKLLLQSVRSFAEQYKQPVTSSWQTPDWTRTDDDASGDYDDSVEARRRIEDDLREAEDTCYLCANFLTGTETQATTGSAIIITGEAGIGKTHYLANVVQQRVAANLPAMLFHGEHFQVGPILPQLCDRLGVDSSTDQFLGALSAAARSCHCRALIVIDALNEADEKTLWRRELPSFLAAIAQWPEIAVVLSIRNTYLDYCLPENFKEAGPQRIGHPGFSGCEDAALLRYFTHYGIPPTAPVLEPEFSNPLFLKTYCEAVSSAPGAMAEARSSLSSLLHLYLKSVNTKIADELRIDPADQPVIKAVQNIAAMMIQIGRRSIPRSATKKILDAIHKTSDFSKSLYRRLLHEGLISETFVRDDVNRSEGDYVRFSYERFGDFWLAQSLLQETTAHDHDTATIREKLQDLLQAVAGDERTRYRNASMLESLLTLIAEIYGIEITQVIDGVFDSPAITIANLAGIPWRSRRGVTDKTELFLRECISRQRYQHEALDCVLRMATRHNHRLNARWLHALLLNMTMPERDALWSIFLHNRWHYGTSLKRIVDWAWNQNGPIVCTTAVRLLCGICLSWFFTSSNRFLRDQSTKALVSIFDRSPEDFCEILVLFETVDDLYVLERIHAVACGLAMRSQDLSATTAIARVVFQQIFAENKPPSHALVRDYARLTVERANHMASTEQFDSSKIRPPFASTLPLKAQSWKYLQEKYSDSVFLQLILSLWPDHGDFARYVLASDSPRGAHGWLQESDLRSKRGMTDDVDASRLVQPEELLADIGKKIVRVNAKYAQPESSDSEKTEDEDFDYTGLDWPDSSAEADSDLDSDLACRWILERVFQLGWTANRFGEFDTNLDSHGRDAKKPERIGKKYQWIAYHEWMSHVTDQRPFRALSSGVYQYAGAWDIGLRDIDPTCLLKGTSHQSNLSQLVQRCWWAAVDYDAWRLELTDVDWMKLTEDLPAVHCLLMSPDPKSGTKYVSLEADATWQSTTLPNRQRYDAPFRRIWYRLQGYLLRTKDVSVFYEWASNQDFYGRWMPESHDTHGLYSGEFFWSPAYGELDRTHHSDAGFKSDGSTRDRQLSCEVVVPTTRFNWEGSGFDCSIDEPISAMMPGIFLAEKMKLRLGKDCGTILDEAGTCIAMDPSVRSPGPSTLLFEQAALDMFLQRHGFSLVWTLLGAKETLGRSIERCGELRLSGVLTYVRGHIQGNMSAYYQSFLSCEQPTETRDVRRWTV